jgi:hypothetical protein
MTRIAPNQRNGQGNRLITGDFYPAFLFTVFVVALNVAVAIIVELPAAAAGAWLHVTTSW